jgi:nuclease S1
VFHALRFAREGLFGDIHTKAGHRLAHPVRATHASTGAGPEGHSIVAEIAQRRLTPEAAAKVREILGENASLASIASWANDYRAVHPDSAGWRFVIIPLAAQDYDEARDCV